MEYFVFYVLCVFVNTDESFLLSRITSFTLLNFSLSLSSSLVSSLKPFIIQPRFHYDPTTFSLTTYKL